MKAFKIVCMLLSIVFISSGATVYFYNHNYVLYSSSPSGDVKLIGIPESDCNATSGTIILKDKHGKRISYFEVDAYNECIYIPSNDGKLVLEIPALIGVQGIRDPRRWTDIVVYREGRPSTIIDVRRFSFKPFKEKYLKNYKLKNTYHTVLYKQDTIALKLYKENMFIKLSEGKRVQRNEASWTGFVPLKFKFKRMNSFEREKLENKELE